MMLDAVSRSPWFGYGWQQISHAQLAVALDHVPINYVLGSSHNLPIDLALWSGVPVALTICGLFIWWFTLRIRACRDVETVVLLLGIVVFVVHSMLEFPLYYAYFLLPVGLMLGAADAKTDPSPVASRAHLRSLATILLIALTVSVGWISTEYLKVEESTRHASLRDAGLIMGSEHPQTPEVWLLDGPREFVRMWLTEPRENMSAAELDQMRATAYRYPVPSALFRYALASALNGKPSEATRTLALICPTTSIARCAEIGRLWLSASAEFPQIRGIAFPPPRP